MERQTTTKTKPESSTSSPLSRGILQRKCACGNQSAGGGECAECSKKNQLLQRRGVHISDPSDRYEQEADRIADQVMRMSEPTTKHQVGSEKEGVLQRKAIANSITPLQPGSAGQEQFSEVPPIVDEVLRSPGQPLDPNTRTFMEKSYGYDFSRVRLYTDAKAAESARTLNALAYTVGENIVFQTGHYFPELSVLAHELTHVIQQNQGKLVKTTVQRQATGKPGSTDPCFDLLQQIIELLNEVARRYDEALNDIHDLFKNYPYMKDPHPGGYGSWEGHRNRFYDDRQKLRNKLEEWDSNDKCRGYNLKPGEAEDLKDAREYANKDFPKKPAPSMRVTDKLDITELLPLIATALAKLGQKKGEAGISTAGNKIPVYAIVKLVAIAVLLASGKAEAKPGPGEDPLATLYKALKQKGATVPPEIQKMLDENQDLKDKLNKVMDEGGDPTKVQEEISKQILDTIAANKDKFTAEDLELLLSITGAAGKTLPKADMSVEELKKLAATKNVTETSKAEGSGSSSISESTSSNKDNATGTSKDKVPEEVAENTPSGEKVPSEIRQQIITAPQPIQGLFLALTSSLKGNAKVNTTVVKRFLELVTLNPPLTGDEINKLIAQSMPAPEASADEAMASLEEAIRRLRPAQAVAPGSGIPSTPTDPSSEVTKPQSTVQDETPKASFDKPLPPPKQTIADVGLAIAKRLKKFTYLAPGENTFAQPLNQVQVGRTSKFFAWRRFDGVLVGNYIFVTIVAPVNNDKWRIKIDPTPLFNENGIIIDTLKGGDTNLQRK